MAANQNANVTLKTLRYLGRFPNGITAEDLAARLNMSDGAARSRLTALYKQGLIRKMPERKWIEKSKRYMDLWVTTRNAKKAAPEGAAELPNGDGVTAQSDGSGQESNNRPGPQDARHGEELICPQEFAEDHHNPSHDRSACKDGEAQPHACLR